VLCLANRHEVALARVPAWFSSAKARRELGYEPSPVESAVERAVFSVLPTVVRESSHLTVRKVR